MPACPTGTLQQQVMQQYSYLFQMAQQLNLALEQLEQASRQIAAGAYSQRTAIHGSDEIASLSRSFDEMAQAVEGTVQSRAGGAYVLAFTTAGGSHRLQYPKPAKGKPFTEGSVVTLFYDPDAPEKMFVEGDKSVLGAELLYAGIGVALLVLMVGLMNR